MFSIDPRARVGISPIRVVLLRPARDGAIIGCLVLAAAHFLGLIFIGVDAHTYWTIDPSHPYGAVATGTHDAFFYSPAFAQLTAPIHAVSWELFVTVWTLLLTAALVWQAGLWTAPALLLVPVFSELTVGNIHLLLGAAVVAAFRWPWVWSFVLLTKITPGVGLLWFAVRHEWRSLGIALGATGLIVGISLAFAPGLWADWLATLTAAAQAPLWVFIVPVPLWIRIVAAVALVVWGARTNRRWTVPVAACLALPVLWVNGLSMLIAVIPLLPWVFGSTGASRWLGVPADAAVARAAPERPLPRPGHASP